MPLDPEPARPALTPPDLANYEARQAALYRALAQYQHAAAGEALVHPGAFGLAVYHQLERYDGDFLRAVLVHCEGGSLDSGPARIDSGDLALLPDELTALVLGVRAPAPSAPAQSQAVEPAPVEVTEAPAPKPEPACPMPAAPEPAEQPDVTDTDDAPPTEQEVEEVLSDLDAINLAAPDALKAILAAYKAEHAIGRTPFVKSITSRDRLATIRRLIAEHQP